MYLKLAIIPKYQTQSITAIPSEILKNRMRHTENSEGLAHLHVFSASHFMFDLRHILCILRLIIIMRPRSSKVLQPQLCLAPSAYGAGGVACGAEPHPKLSPQGLGLVLSSLTTVT